MKSESDVLVVGAGLTGLVAARVLKEQGLQVLVVDKEERVGGRAVTDPVGPGRADAGLQFLTARFHKFQSWLQPWLDEGLVYSWATDWTEGSLPTVPVMDQPHYAVRGGMNVMVERLAEGLEIRLNTPATAVTPLAEGWQIQTGAGQTHTAQALLLTPPIPQSLLLLTAGQTQLVETDWVALGQIKYEPCLVGLFQIEGQVNLPEPGAVQRPSEQISWIADNRRKGISPEATVVTVQAKPGYSHQLWDEPDEVALAAIQTGLQPFLAPTATIVESRLKRWPYALPTGLHHGRYLLASGLARLAFAGDAFGGPRAEGAILSGLAVGQALVDRMTG